jgi:EmrB/QacA subfamily drug resistance transporter
MANTETAAGRAVGRASRPGSALGAVAVVQFMVSLDLSVVNVALPKIGTSLGFSSLGLTWVINAYALTFGGLLLLGGKIADQYGNKRLLEIGLPAFGIASLLGGFAQSPGELIAARAVQGVGAALMAPAALALLVSTFPEGKERLKAFGVWSAVNAAGGAVGVLAGGLLTQYANWRWVMFINLPMAALALYLVARGVGTDRAAVRRTRPDVLGGLLATAGLAGIVLGVVRTNQYTWGSPTTVATLAVSAALLIAFVVVEATTRRDPLIRLGLFGNRFVSGANVFTLLLGGVLSSAFYFMSLYLQRVLGTGPAKTGVEFLPLAVAVVLGSGFAVRLGEKVSPKILVMIGGLITAGGFFWFGQIKSTGSFAGDVLGPSIVLGIGFGLCLAPGVTIATFGVARQEAGTASGLLNSSRQIGASLGLAALGTAANDRTGHLPTPDALNRGYALGMNIGAIIVVVGVVLAFLLLPRMKPTSATAGAAPTDADTAAAASAA